MCRERQGGKVAMAVEERGERTTQEPSNVHDRGEEMDQAGWVLLPSDCRPGRYFDMDFDETASRIQTAELRSLESEHEIERQKLSLESFTSPAGRDLEAGRESDSNTGDANDRATALSSQATSTRVKNSPMHLEDNKAVQAYSDSRPHAPMSFAGDRVRAGDNRRDMPTRPIQTRKVRVEEEEESPLLLDIRKDPTRASFKRDVFVSSMMPGEHEDVEKELRYRKSLKEKELRSQQSKTAQEVGSYKDADKLLKSRPPLKDPFDLVQGLCRYTPRPTDPDTRQASLHPQPPATSPSPLPLLPLSSPSLLSLPSLYLLSLLSFS
eukprot:367341-Hanusia_phi.AAC.1